MFAIFKTTYLEIKRSRAYQGLLIFAFVLLASSNIFTFFTREEELKIIKDMGLMAVNLFGIIFVLFGLSRQIPGEIENKTIYTILTNPLGRCHILLGNLLAYLYVLFISFLIMAGIFYGLLYLKEGSVDLLMGKGIILIFLKTLLLAGLVLFFSVFFPPVLNITFSLFLYLAGHFSNYLNAIADQKNFLGWILFKGLYTVLPNFENFNCSDALALRIDVSWGYIAMAGLYSLLYGLAIFLMTCLLFKDKEV